MASNKRYVISFPVWHRTSAERTVRTLVVSGEITLDQVEAWVAKYRDGVLGFGAVTIGHAESSDGE